MVATYRHRVFVGLGNIGKRYEMTRHNMGFLAVDSFALRHGLELKEASRFQAKVAKGVVKDITLHLLEPTTYMNASGRSVALYLKYFQLPLDALCVVTDDVALPFGDLRLKPSGSSGGHNGLKSVEQHVGTRHYARLRVGIAGEHHKKGALEDYVLEKFSSREMDELPEILDNAANALEMLLTRDFESVMKEVNTKAKQVPDAGQEKNQDESNREKSL